MERERGSESPRVAGIISTIIICKSEEKNHPPLIHAEAQSRLYLYNNM